MAAKLIQIYYRTDKILYCGRETTQLEEMYSIATPYFNEGLTIFFENSVLAQLVMETKAEKVGVASWKLREKMRTNVCRPRELTEEVINTDYDVLSFTCNTKYHKMLAAAEIWHKGFRPALEKVCEVIGQKCPGEVRSPIYQNAFMARTDIYQDYVKNWLNPAMEAMTNDKELNVMVKADSNYSNLNKRDAASPERLQELIGMPFYPLAPFILERLFSIYVHNKRINVTWL